MGLAELFPLISPPSYGPYVTDDVRRGELGTMYQAGVPSTELSITETDPRLLGGRPVNIPLMVRGQRPAGLAELMMGMPSSDEQREIAILRAIERIKAGGFLPTYASIQEAVRAAEARSRAEKMNPYVRQMMELYTPQINPDLVVPRGPATEQLRQYLMRPVHTTGVRG